MSEINKILDQRFTEIPLANVKTFGCAQNENDSEKIRGVLYNSGYGMTSDDEKSDIMIFNSCAIRENAELKIFGNIGKIKAIKKANPNMIVAVCGCMVMQEHIVEKIKKSYSFVDIVFGVNDIQKLPELISDFYKNNKKQISSPNKETGVFEDISVLRSNEAVASISIMYGCDNFCSYCIVPYVRGRERSRDKESIYKEFLDLINKGYKDITLLGQNVNSYGKNLDEEYDFADLLELLCTVDGEYTIHFMSSHPKDITKKVIDTIARNKNISRHIHLPVQAGSNRVLEIMNRRYTKESYLDIINYAKEKIEGVSFSSDIIVGFPSETYDEYLETESLIKEIKYTQLFTYIYSKRNGTKAADLEDNITHKEKSEWVNKLIKIQQDIQHSHLDSYIGKEVRALVYEENEGVYTAKMKNTLLVKFTSDDKSVLNSYINLKITSKQGITLHAKVI